MFYTFKELNRELCGDSKSFVVQRALVRRGMLQKDGNPTAHQLALGNFKMRPVRTVTHDGASIRFKVTITPQGYREIKRIIRKEKFDV